MAGSKTIHVAAYYRPHEGDQDSLMELQQSLSRLDKGHHMLIAGDFNFPGWDWKNLQVSNCNHPALHHQFGDLLDDQGLVQLVEEPTRRSNILDLFLTNIPGKVSKVSVVTGISDHDCPILQLDMRPTSKRQQPRKVPIYSKADWKGFETRLLKVAEEIATTKDDASVEELWAIFKTGIQEGIANDIPHKMLRRKGNLPWVTSRIRKLIRQRDRLCRRYRTLQNETDRLLQPNIEEQIRQLKGKIQAETRKAYWEYLHSIFTGDEGSNEWDGMKRFWSFVKHSRTDSSKISHLKAEGVKVTHPAGKASALNRQFKKAFSRETPIPPDLLPPTATHPTMPDIDITTAGIQKQLEKLKTRKAPGPDGITPIVLKQLAHVIAPILTEIYRKSYSTGEVPRDWRRANVVPIYKKGDRSDPSNYRPISLTCIASKLMEHVLASNIMSHAETHDLLYHLQHGFRKQRSCELQLTGLVSDLTNNMHHGKQTDILVMDFSKAFDKVGHGRLLHKLDHYGVKGKTNRWIRNFLQHRTQQVVLEGQTSEEVEVDSGVPQGSVLGPSMFLFYVNDLSDSLSSSVRLFADDTIIYLTIQSEDDTNQLQGDLDKLAEWSKAWSMELNTEKCQVITVTRNHTVVNHQYRLNDTILKSVTSAKYLGVTLTSDLTWNTHITNICQKANKSLGFLRRNLQIHSTKLKEMAYKTLVRPLVEYSASVWDPYSDRNIHQLEMVQRRAARYVTNRYHNTSSVSEMLHQLDWEPLAVRRENIRLAMMYNIHNDLVVFNSQQYITPVPRATRHVHQHGYRVPHSRTDYHMNSFFPRTVRAWNNLPLETVMSSSLAAFRQNLVKGRN